MVGLTVWMAVALAQAVDAVPDPEPSPEVAVAVRGELVAPGEAQVWPDGRRDEAVTITFAEVRKLVKERPGTASHRYVKRHDTGVVACGLVGGFGLIAIGAGAGTAVGTGRVDNPLSIGLFAGGSGLAVASFGLAIHAALAKHPAVASWVTEDLERAPPAFSMTPVFGPGTVGVVGRF